MMETGYCPDFSDICNDNPEFWDFLNSAKEKKKPHEFNSGVCNQERVILDTCKLSSLNGSKISLLNENPYILANEVKNKIQEKVSKTCSPDGNFKKSGKVEELTERKNSDSENFWDCFNLESKVPNFRSITPVDVYHKSVSKLNEELKSSNDDTLSMTSDYLTTPNANDISSKVTSDGYFLINTGYFREDQIDKSNYRFLSPEFEGTTEDYEGDPESEESYFSELDHIRCLSNGSFDTSFVTSPILYSAGSSDSEDTINVEKFLNDYHDFHRGSNQANAQVDCVNFKNVTEKAIDKDDDFSEDFHEINSFSSDSLARSSITSSPVSSTHTANSDETFFKFLRDLQTLTPWMDNSKISREEKVPEENGEFLSSDSSNGTKIKNVSQPLLENGFKNLPKEQSCYKSDRGRNLVIEKNANGMKRYLRTDGPFKDYGNENLNEFHYSKKLCSNSTKEANTNNNSFTQISQINSLETDISLNSVGNKETVSLRNNTLLTNYHCTSSSFSDDTFTDSINKHRGNSIELINIEQNKLETLGEEQNEEQEMQLPRIECVFQLPSHPGWPANDNCSETSFRDLESLENIGRSNEISAEGTHSFVAQIPDFDSHSAEDHGNSHKFPTGSINTQTNDHYSDQIFVSSSHVNSSTINWSIHNSKTSFICSVPESKQKVDENNCANINQQTSIKKPLVNAVPLVFQSGEDIGGFKNKTQNSTNSSHSVENSIQVSNSKPLYLILPKSLGTSQNQSSQFLMIINNDTRSADTSGTVVLDHNINRCYNPNLQNKLNTTVGSQPTNSNQQVSNNCIQSKPSAPGSYIIFNEFPVTASFNNLQSNVTYKPAVQHTRDNGPESSPFNSKKIAFSNAGCNNYGANLHLPTNALMTSSVKDGIFKVNNTNTVANLATSSALGMPIIRNNVHINHETYVGTSLERKQLDAGQSGSENMSKLLQTLYQKDQGFSKAKNPISKPIKSIALGKDKTAIQQTSVPLKIDSFSDRKLFSFGEEESKVSFPPFILSEKLLITSAEGGKQNSSSIAQQIKGNAAVALGNFKECNSKVLRQQHMLPNNKFLTESKIPAVVTSCTMPRQDDLKVCPVVVTTECSVIPNTNSEKSLSNPLSTGKDSYLKGRVTENPKQPTIPIHTTCSVQQNGESLKPNVIGVPVYSQQTQNSNASVFPQKTALAAIQELFPAPISMIPVCVVQTTQTYTKPLVSKVLVLQGTTDQNAGFRKLQTNASFAKQKTANLKKANLKCKKTGRKTVRELLLERYQKTAGEQPEDSSSKKELETKILRPIFRCPTNIITTTRPSSSTVVTPSVTVWKDSVPSTSNLIITNVLSENCNPPSNSNKRPNILLLPSASRLVKESFSKTEIKEVPTKKEYPQVSACEAALTPPAIPLLPSFSNESKSTKDRRPRHYDMSELEIGYFKVMDDAYSSGRFRSKFKVLFTKREFHYEFPLSKCNQIDVSSPQWGKMARITVAFKTLVSLDMRGRKICVQVYSPPSIFFGRPRNLSGLTSKAVSYDTLGDQDAFWRNSMQNSFVHKIVLKKRQTDKLKSYLCQFNQTFVLLCNTRSLNDTPQLIEHPSPLEEEMAASNPRKLFSKARRNIIRRLPLWSESFVKFQPKETEQFLSSSNVCSCRISCRSVRCSCVKAAKSCGSVCLCSNCNNPLNVLESLGLNLEFALSDSCLFQNIYQIPNLVEFLQRDIKLTCCKSFARVQDCIPGTVLCPNVDCNTPLEFSWCRRIVCNPERNPRNHCSFCGQCCLSNGQHCLSCNRCYFVSSKCPNCPNCRDKRSSFRAPIQKSKQENYSAGQFHSESFQYSTKSSTKPEIVVLDGNKSFPVQKSVSIVTEHEEIEKGSVKSEADSTVQEAEGQNGDSDLQIVAVDSEDPLIDIKTEVKVTAHLENDFLQGMKTEN